MLALTLPKQGWAHRIWVGPKLAALMCVSIIAFPISTLAGAAFLVLLPIILFASMGRISFLSGMRSLRPLWMFCVIILGFHALTAQVNAGFVIVLKFVALVGIANFVTMTSRLSDMMTLVEKLLAPLRLIGVNPRHIALAFSLVIRFTPVYINKGKQLIEAWRARSAKRVGWRIALPLVVLALDDADHIAEALRARGATVKTG